LVARGIYHTTASRPAWDGLASAGSSSAGVARGWVRERRASYTTSSNDAPRPVDVLVPVGRSARAGGEWQFIRERPGARSARSVGAPPRLTVEDTVLDLSAEGSVTSDLVALVTEAVQGRKTTSRRLLKAMNERSRYKHRKVLGDILRDVAVGAELNGQTRTIMEPGRGSHHPW
jgi:hypothetical protein